MIQSARQLRAKLLNDRHRPTYHFVTPEGVCMPFDPNGAIFWKGKYHLCYIFQDERGHCWGHASSKDLIHWRHHPTALAPNPGDPDRQWLHHLVSVDAEYFCVVALASYWLHHAEFLGFI